jgi:hypothetical protein
VTRQTGSVPTVARVAAALVLAGSALATGGAPRAEAALAATAAGSGTVVVSGSPTSVVRLADPRIAESSGLAGATLERDVLFTHNDSGDTARFFAVDAESGRTIGTYDVPGVTAVDWEDIATGPGPGDRPSVWLADIGDNGSSRSSIDVYVVWEPRVDRGSAVAKTRVAPLTGTFRLRYPDGPHDAETLLVDPTSRRAFIVTKSASGRSGVYALPPRPTGHAVATMRRVGAVTFPLTGSRGGPLGLFGALTATGGSVAPNGELLAIRTYTDVYVWRLGPAGVPEALRHPAGWRIPAPPQPQGEGVAFGPNSRRLLLSSEGAGSAIYAVRAPAVDPEGDITGAVAGEEARPADPSGGAPTVAIGLGVVAAIAAGVLAVGAWLRHRRRTA